MAGKARRTAAVLALLLLAAALFSLCLGASGISLWAGRGDALRGVDSAPARVLLHIRLPRTLAAMLAGAALSCAGVMIQGVLGNPLAGPNVIGVNAGAGLTTLLLATLAPSAVAFLPAAAFCFHIYYVFANTNFRFLNVFVVFRCQYATYLVKVLTPSFFICNIYICSCRFCISFAGARPSSSGRCASWRCPHSAP